MKKETEINVWLTWLSVEMTAMEKTQPNQSNHTNCCNDTEAVYTIRKFCCHLFKLTVFAGGIIVKRLLQGLQLSNRQIICQNHATKVFSSQKWQDICYLNRIAVGKTVHIFVCTVRSISITVLELRLTTSLSWWKKPLERLNEIKKYFQLQEQSKLQSITNCWQSE